MGEALHHWSHVSIALCGAAIALWHELGLRRLLRVTRRDRVRRRRLRSLWFYGGVVAVLIAVCSPLEYWGFRYYLVHTVQHLLLMFAAPSMIAAGAPWQPLLVAAPLALRRRALPGLVHGAWSRPLRAAGRLALRPLPVLAAFNLVMVGWQIPGVFDLSEESRLVHVWLLNGSMLLAGVLFWLLIVRSPPLRVRITLAGQAAALVVTNFVMWALAVSMSLFTDHSWYSVYAHVPGVSLSPLADQQLGAGLLWICGDFWAVPALVIVLRRLISREEGGVDAALERILGQSAASRLRSPRASGSA